MKLTTLIALVLISLTDSKAQATINRVVDTASYAPRVAPGALATIFGSGLSRNTVQASGFPLPRNLGGTSVMMNSAPFPLLYVSPTQINFQVPSDLAPGNVTILVTVDGGRSAPFAFTVVRAAPSIFQDDSHHALAQNASDDYSFNSPAHPAVAGSIVVVYLTGQGAVDNRVADGVATPSSPLSTATGPATATIGGVSAPIRFLGLTPGFAGLAQANIEVPGKLASSDYPLTITVGGYGSASAVLSVSGHGAPPPRILSLVGQLNYFNGTFSSVAVVGNVTYVCEPSRIHIIDTTHASNPRYAGDFGAADLGGMGGSCMVNTAAKRPILVDVVGPGTSSAFLVYDVSKPFSPVTLGLITAQYKYIADLSFIGTVGFASTSWYEYNSAYKITGQHGDFISYDFSNLIPGLISALTPSPDQPASNDLNMRPNALALVPNSSYPNTAYVATTTATGNSTLGDAALDVIDVSSVLNMKALQRVTVPNSAIFLGLAYENRLLLATGNTTGPRSPGVPDFSITGNLTLTTMDITSVRSPVPIATVVTNVQTKGTYNVQPLGKSIFAITNNPPTTDANGPGSLMIVDATNPKQPVLYHYSTRFGMSGISSVNGFLLVPHINGLDIFQIQLP